MMAPHETNPANRSEPPLDAAAPRRALLLALAGCAGTPEAAARARCASPRPARRVPVNWPAPPEEIERRLAGEPFELRKIAGTGAGTTGALKLDAVLSRSTATPSRSSGSRCRRETPTATTTRRARRSRPTSSRPGSSTRPTTWCRPRPCAAFRPRCCGRTGCRPSRTCPARSCVLGVLSVWLEQVTVPERVFEPERFASDAAVRGEPGTLQPAHLSGRARGRPRRQHPRLEGGRGSPRLRDRQRHRVRRDGEELVRPQLERAPHPRGSPPRDRAAAARSTAARDRPARRGGGDEGRSERDARGRCPRARTATPRAAPGSPRDGSSSASRARSSTGWKTAWRSCSTASIDGELPQF